MEQKVAVEKKTKKVRGRTLARSSEMKEATVKWFDSRKSYGFISLAVSGKLIFIHVSALRRSGVNELLPGQRIRVEVVNGGKGFEAHRITVA